MNRIVPDTAPPQPTYSIDGYGSNMTFKEWTVDLTVFPLKIFYIGIVFVVLWTCLT